MKKLLQRHTVSPLLGRKGGQQSSLLLMRGLSVLSCRVEKERDGKRAKYCTHYPPVDGVLPTALCHHVADHARGDNEPGEKNNKRHPLLPLNIALQHQNEQLPGVRRVTVSLASPIDSLMVLKVVASILFVKVLPPYMTPACSFHFIYRV